MNRSDFPTFPTELPNWPVELIEQRLSPDFHGDFNKWQQAIAQLPDNLDVIVTPGDTVHLALQTDVDLAPPLRALMPWRKGPFQFGDVFIDSEWRSDWKWQRLAAQIDLAGQRVLDVGCGNGYFGWRMLQAGAREVVGVDPTLTTGQPWPAARRIALARTTARRSPSAAASSATLPFAP